MSVIGIKDYYYISITQVAKPNRDFKKTNQDIK